MDRLQELISDYPDSTIIKPSCGAKVVYTILELFEKEPVSLDLLEYAIDSDGDTKQSSLLNIKGQLEANSLYTAPMRASLEEVDKSFDSYASIIHTKDINQNIEQAAPNHFEVLIKKGNTYISIDSPAYKTFKTFNSNDIQEMSKELGYAQTILIVSDKPIDVGNQYDYIPLLLLFILMLIGLSMVTSRFRMKKGVKDE